MKNDQFNLFELPLYKFYTCCLNYDRSKVATPAFFSKLRDSTKAELSKPLWKKIRIGILFTVNSIFAKSSNKPQIIWQLFCVSIQMMLPTSPWLLIDWQGSRLYNAGNKEEKIFVFLFVRTHFLPPWLAPTLSDIGQVTNGSCHLEHHQKVSSWMQKHHHHLDRSFAHQHTFRQWMTNVSNTFLLIFIFFCCSIFLHLGKNLLSCWRKLDTLTDENSWGLEQKNIIYICVFCYPTQFRSFIFSAQLSRGKLKSLQGSLRKNGKCVNVPMFVMHGAKEFIFWRILSLYKAKLHSSF